MEPKVSHFIITYNQKDFITDAVMSAVKQDYGNLQIVVADDGSTDGTQELIHGLALKYPGRVLPVCAEKNAGITANCNRALSYCDGKYISNQGGDDILLPGKIRKQVEWFEADERRVICGHDVEVFYTGEYGREKHRGSGGAGREGVGAGKLIREGVASFFMGTSWMWRASAGPVHGFDTRLHLVSDWKFLIDIVGEKGIWGAVPGVYASYRRHPRNISTLARDEIMRDCARSLRIMRSEYPGFREQIDYARVAILYNLAKVCFRNGMKVRARRMFLRLLKSKIRHDNVSKVRSFKYFIKCYLSKSRIEM